MFKDIPGFDGYRINEKGKIYSKFVKRYLKPATTWDGYLRIELKQNKQPKKMFVHRLVLLTFMGESELQVNHIDGNKKNNHIDNLEYCTVKHNVKHSFDKLGRIALKGKYNSRSKIVYQLDEQGNVLNKFYGTREAERKTGIANVQISRVCRGLQEKTNGFYFSYKI